MKRVLLNVTAHELERISGDISYYRNLLETSVPAVEFCILHPVSSADWLLRELRKGTEKMLSARWPQPLNQGLFELARYTHLPARVAHQADVILSHITFPLVVGAGDGPPIVWSTQGISPALYYDYRGKVRFEQVVRLFNDFGRKASRLIVWTRSGADMVRRHCDVRAPLHVVPPSLPVPAAVTQPLPREAERHLLFIGRDPARKGLYEILEAFEQLGQAAANTQLDIVSCVPPPLRDRYRPHANVRFHCDLPDGEISRLFERADIFLLPTHAETYGFVLIEAMARGCAIITCDYAPLNELVEVGVNGLLVPPADADSIAAALGALVRDPLLVEQMGCANRQKYRSTFAPQKVASQLTEVLCA